VAKRSTSASTNSVNPDPGRAQGTLICPRPMLWAAHPGQPGMQERLVPEEIQMPPGLLHTLVHRTTRVRAVLGRADEPGTTIKIQIQIQLSGLGVELTARHPPRPAQTQRRREQSQLIPTPTPPATRPSRTVTQPTKPSPLVNPPRRDHHHLIIKPHLMQRGTWIRPVLNDLGCRCVLAGEPADESGRLDGAEKATFNSIFC
jgi:hypothetical protein